VEEDEDEVDPSLLDKFTYAYLRRFGLGVLRMKPDEFGKTLVGDFLDAVAGYNEQRAEDFKTMISVIRTATYLSTVKKEDNLSMKQFWRLPWDDEGTGQPVSREMYEESMNKASEFFRRAGLI